MAISDLNRLEGLRKALAVRNVQAKALSLSVGVSSEKVSALLSGDRKLTLHWLDTIAAALNLSTSALMAEIDGR